MRMACGVLALALSSSALCAEAKLSPEAKSVLSCMLETGQLSSVVINTTGLLSKTGEAQQLGFALASPWSIAMHAFEEDKPGLSAPMGRFFVAAAAADVWKVWPDLLGVGIAAIDPMSGLATKDLGGTAVVLFLNERAATSDELMRGFLALARATHKETAALFTRVRGNTCMTSAARPDDTICLRPGKGYALVGAPEGLDAIESEIRAGASAELPALLSGRINLRERGELTFSVFGTTSFDVKAALKTADAEERQQTMDLIQVMLSRYDGTLQRQTATVAKDIEQLKQMIQADTDAPTGLKTAVASLKPHDVLDPKDRWAKARQSVQVKDDGARVSLSVSVPTDGPWAKLDGSAIAILGVLSAIAVPNFVRFQCRSKQSEARVNLKALSVAQRAFFAEKDRYAKSFAEAGFQPEPGRYAYCDAKVCLECAAGAGKKCVTKPVAKSPCAGKVKAKPTVFSACAYGNVDTDEAVDVWSIDETFMPENVINDCTMN